MKPKRTLTLEQAFEELAQHGVGVLQASEHEVFGTRDFKAMLLDKTHVSEPRFRWEQDLTGIDDGLPRRSTRSFLGVIECLENAFLEGFNEEVVILGD